MSDESIAMMKLLDGNDNATDLMMAYCMQDNPNVAVAKMCVKIVRLERELEGLRLMEKKVLHGCWDAYCKECDG